MPNLDDLDKKLAEASEGSEAWKPREVGDQLAGTVTIVGSFTHPDYGTSAMLTIRTDDGSVKVDGKAVKSAGMMRVGMFGTVLSGVMGEQNIRTGDWIAIRYLGMKNTKSGTVTYKNYAVIVEHPTVDTKLDAAASEFA